MSGFWAMFWLVLVLKIPLVMLLGIVWWALRQTPVEEVGPDGERGGSDRDPDPRIRPPQPPRRGPHADPPPRPPERVRVYRAPRQPVR